MLPPQQLTMLNSMPSLLCVLHDYLPLPATTALQHPPPLPRPPTACSLELKSLHLHHDMTAMWHQFLAQQCMVHHTVIPMRGGTHIAYPLCFAGPPPSQPLVVTLFNGPPAASALGALHHHHSGIVPSPGDSMCQTGGGGVASASISCCGGALLSLSCREVVCPYTGQELEVTGRLCPSLISRWPTHNLLL